LAEGQVTHLIKHDSVGQTLFGFQPARIKGVLRSLPEAHGRQRTQPGAARRIARQLREEDRELSHQLNQLAALVDAAWQET
jgi:hypothetical protein